MNADPAGRFPEIGLEVEPLVFFHPVLAGRAVPGEAQPVPNLPLLEEEPAIWPQLDLEPSERGAGGD
jgi:hypothetical protein